jgi:hypothetical protein
MSAACAGRRPATPCRSQCIAPPGACGKARVVLQNLQPAT